MPRERGHLTVHHHHHHQRVMRRFRVRVPAGDPSLSRPTRLAASRHHPAALRQWQCRKLAVVSCCRCRRLLPHESTRRQGLRLRISTASPLQALGVFSESQPPRCPAAWHRGWAGAHCALGLPGGGGGGGGGGEMGFEAHPSISPVSDAYRGAQRARRQRRARRALSGSLCERCVREVVGLGSSRPRCCLHLGV